MRGVFTASKCAAALLLAVSVLPLRGALTRDVRRFSPGDFKQLSADSWRAVGKNIIIEGNAYMPAKTMEIFADQIVINVETLDFEASGHVQVHHWVDSSAPASLGKIEEMEKMSNVLVRSVSSSVSVLGERTYTVNFAVQADRITADKVTGNMSTSYFSFVNPAIRYNTFVCRAESGERAPDGIVTLRNAEMSSCTFLESDNAHYSIAAAEIKLIPYPTQFYRHERFKLDKGDTAALLFNGMVKIYGVPLLWLPVFYKPKDESPGICGFQYGRSSSLGYFINLYRRFRITDYPDTAVRVHADWYEKRGFGYGADGRIATDETRTDFFVYSIYDNHPHANDDYDHIYRLKVPNARYDFHVSNLSHITPRLDFRGVFDYQSDPYFLRDFFPKRYDTDPQPATFAALEQQFDRFSLAGYLRFRTNDFFTAVEKIPEVRMDIPRQEIFDTGIYYQGDFSADYMRMRWIKFDRYQWPYTKLRNYDAFRFDTTHFLYYPIANRYFTFMPRAGFRLTSYSHTSKTKIKNDDLRLMFAAAEPQSMGREFFKRYDQSGKAKVRLAAELGFELSTKIHNTWQDVRSEFFQIDGLRHIAQPYINYTFIPKPTLNRDKILFFDDIDRITKQNFFRFGIINRLQTRDGGGVSDLLYMENYWDIHLEKAEGMSAFGNIGTIISAKLFKGLSLNTEFLIDISGDGKIADTIRHGRNAGRTGLAQKWLNMWDINLTYTPAPDWKFTVGYNYVRPYDMRSAYSMGSTLTQINSASYFLQYNNRTDEDFYLRASLPLTPDHRTFGSFLFTYDVQEGSIDKVGMAVLRKFHCWELILTLGFDRNYNITKHKWKWDFEYSVSANFTGLTDSMNNVQNTVLQRMDNTIANLKF